MTEDASMLEPSINRLFAVTLKLTAMASCQPDQRAANRLLGVVHEIDEVIREIRNDLIDEAVAHRELCDGEHHTW